jgi:hypothetical protein
MKNVAYTALIVGLLLLSATGRETYASSSPTIVPISGTVVVPLADSTEDTVTLNGEFHVVVGLTSSETGSNVRINANLSNVSGFGSPSGLKYEAVGASSIVLHNVESPSSPPPQTFTFDLIRRPPSPCVPPSPCNADNTPVIVPLDVTFAVTETEPGYWSVNISCIAHPPSPCGE